MKTFPLRQLVRDPKMVKKLTAAGDSVRITDSGVPLWVISPAPEATEESREAKAARARWMDGELDALLKEPKTKVSLARLIEEGRR